MRISRQPRTSKRCAFKRGGPRRLLPRLGHLVGAARAGGSGGAGQDRRRTTLSGHCLLMSAAVCVLQRSLQAAVAGGSGGPPGAGAQHPVLPCWAAEANCQVYAPNACIRLRLSNRPGRAGGLPEETLAPAGFKLRRRFKGRRELFCCTPKSTTMCHARRAPSSALSKTARSGKHVLEPV